MTPEQLKEQIDFKINEGRGYQDIYDELNKTYPGREIDLARLIADVPLLSQRMKYEKRRLGMIGLIVALAGLQLVRLTIGALQDNYYPIVFALGPAVLLGLLYGLARWNRTMIRTAGYIAGFMLLLYGRMLTRDAAGIDILADVALLGLITWLGTDIGHHLGGKYKMGSGQQYTDAKGQIRARHQIRFQG